MGIIMNIKVPYSQQKHNFSTELLLNVLEALYKNKPTYMYASIIGK